LPLRLATVGATRELEALRTAAATEDVRAAAVIARDLAEPAAVIVGSANGRWLVVAWPSFSGTVPPDTASRRATSTGWVLAGTPIETIASPVTEAAGVFGDRVSATAVPAGPGPLDTVLNDGVALHVAGVPTESSEPVVLTAVLTAIACLALLALSALDRRRQQRTLRKQEALNRQVRLASQIGLTVQESLDMGVMLPSVLAQAADALRLSWVRVVSGPTGRGVEVLALGRRPALAPVQRASSDDAMAAAGQLVEFPLRRGARTLGRLEAVPSVGLDPDELAGLRQTADLLAGALYNADLYEREQESVRRLREIDELKDDFLATVSHELRTPLSVLVGSVSLLVHQWDRIPEAMRRETIVTMQRHTMSLTGLVNDLLDFISDRRMTAPTLEQVALDRSVGELVETLRPLAKDRELHVVADQPVQAWTDPRAVERIIGNFLANAAKYSAAGTTVTVTVAAAGDDALVSVSDEGPGIRPEDRMHIFDRFYRGDSEVARSTRGSGIGLAVAIEWMRAVGARLEARSTVGSGTTLTVHFPTVPDQQLEGAGTVVWLDADRRQEELAR
jgi:signal transduction histidine kinase